MMMFAGRIVLETTLDPLPHLFRTAPGCIAINTKELAALRAGDGPTFKRLLAICQVEDDLESERKHG